jgi:phosphoenolpyruvate-protein phosphotransferase (PTS system enzyme I)
MTVQGGAAARATTVSASAVITNHSGLHARPAVKLTKLAKRFDAAVRMRIGAGEWIDAKSVVKVMGMRAAAGETLHFAADGADAAAAVEALVALTRRDFDEGSPVERQFKGQVASSGLVQGVIATAAVAGKRAVAAAHPENGKRELAQAIASARAELEKLIAASDKLAAEILEFQLEFLGDSKLVDPALQAVAEGNAAADAWRRVLDREIAAYRADNNQYFRARASDLADLRDRVLRALEPDEKSADIADGAILVAEDLAPSRFLEIDWQRCRGVVLREGSIASHVSMLARARGVPLLVQLGAAPEELTEGAPVVLDAEGGHLILHPAEATLKSMAERIAARAARQEQAERYRALPALGRGGERIQVLINIDDPERLAAIDPASCDGVGLTRTEFLFHGTSGFPDEQTQFRCYRRIVEWAGGRPVTIRTLDAGGDKPIAGLTPEGETNPFLGVRGVRLSLAHPGLFKAQLRALARTAALGTVKVMLPMVTTPDELSASRELLHQCVDELLSAGVPARTPALGIMVEVPAAALCVDRFDADFYSIGSNDLIQYTTASSRDCASVGALYDARNPAVLELIARVAAHGSTFGREVSLCGDMAADPELVPLLLDAGLRALSVAPSALARVKLAIAEHGAAA